MMLPSSRHSRTHGSRQVRFTFHHLLWVSSDVSARACCVVKTNYAPCLYLSGVDHHVCSRWSVFLLHPHRPRPGFIFRVSSWLTRRSGSKSSDGVAMRSSHTLRILSLHHLAEFAGPTITSHRLEGTLRVQQHTLQLPRCHNFHRRHTNIRRRTAGVSFQPGILPASALAT